MIRNVMTVVEHRVAVLCRKHERDWRIVSMLCLMLTGSISGIASALLTVDKVMFPALRLNDAL